jgi:hypothetical protein
LKSSSLQQLIIMRHDSNSMHQLMRIKEWTTEERAWYVFGVTITLPLVVAVVTMFSLSYSQFVFSVNMILLCQSMALVCGGLYYLPQSKCDNLGMKFQFSMSVFLLAFYTLAVGGTYAFRASELLYSITTFTGSFIPCVVFFVLVGWPAIVCHRIACANKKKELTYLLFQNQNIYDECTLPISPISPICQSPRSAASSLPFLPVYSHKYRQVSMETLDVILRSPSLLSDFAKFLEREYSLERLLFLIAMKGYRSLGSNPCTTYGQAFNSRNRIISEFILPSSPNKVIKIALIF